MAHLASQSAYAQLSDRLNRFPQGAPPTDLLFKILALLFNEREAALVSQLPVKPFTAKKAAASCSTFLLPQCVQVTVFLPYSANVINVSKRCWQLLQIKS